VGALQKIVIVIPFFNESERLDFAQMQALFSDSPAVEVYCMNDGSMDNTGQRLTEWAAGHPRQVKLFHLPRNVGKAEAVRQGMLAALASGAALTGYIDADMAAPASEIRRLIHILEAGPDDLCAVIGARVRLLGWKIERNPWRHYVGRCFATAASLVLRLPIYDTQCGAKFFRHTPALESALGHPFHSRWIFDVELIDRLAKASRNLRIDPCVQFLEVPLQAWSAKPGSKLTAISFIQAGWDLLWILRKK